MSLTRNDGAKLRFFLVFLIILGKSFISRCDFSQKPFLGLSKITTFAKQVANQTLQDVITNGDRQNHFFEINTHERYHTTSRGNRVD